MTHNTVNTDNGDGPGITVPGIRVHPLAYGIAVTLAAAGAVAAYHGDWFAGSGWGLAAIWFAAYARAVKRAAMAAIVAGAVMALAAAEVERAHNPTAGA